MVSPTSMADMVPVDEVRAIDVNWGRSRRCAGGGHHGNTSLRCLIRREMTRACHRAPVNSNLSIDPPGRSGNVLTTRCRGSGRLVTSARRGGALCPFVGRVTIITNRLPNPTSSDAATSVTRTTDGPDHLIIYLTVGRHFHTRQYDCSSFESRAAAACAEQRHLLKGSQTLHGQRMDRRLEGGVSPTLLLRLDRLHEQKHVSDDTVNRCDPCRCARRGPYRALQVPSGPQQAHCARCGVEHTHPHECGADAACVDDPGLYHRHDRSYGACHRQRRPRP